MGEDRARSEGLVNVVGVKDVHVDAVDPFELEYRGEDVDVEPPGFAGGAGSGRNLGASYPARSEELQTLASNIFNPSTLSQFDPVNTLIRRISGLLPGAQYQSTATQPVFKTGLF